MKHTSIKLNTPCEFINITPVNPLISKCQIKVCYVDDKPNRNKSVITKDVATEMANSLPGSPIVGFFNENAEDFEEHNRIIELSNGEFRMRDNTRPYGFVDLGAKVWFQKFLDDGVAEREYLMTEGYLWTGQYPECKRVVEKGNNHSMELDEKTLNATWAKDSNGKPQFFIINKAIISKLCILGEENEPCFEGSQINVNFSFDDGFKNTLFSMMNELKEFMKEGGPKVFTQYAVEIGDSLWNSLWSYVETKYPGEPSSYCSIYRIEGVYEDAGQKFAILQNRQDQKYYRMDFSLTDVEGFVPSDALTEVTKSYTPAAEPQFALADVEAFETDYASKKKAEEEDKNNKSNGQNPDNKSEGNDNKKNPDNGEPSNKSDKGDNGENDDDKKKKKNYSLEDVVEYTELKAQYDELQTKFAALETENNSLKEQIAPLAEFKNAAEKKDKEDMIAKFYMLSDEDKADVVENIDKYSLDDIEAKLSVICVRNKVSFDLDENNKPNGATTFNLNDNGSEDDDMPAWVKAAFATANKN